MATFTGIALLLFAPGMPQASARINPEAALERSARSGCTTPQKRSLFGQHPFSRRSLYGKAVPAATGKDSCLDMASPARLHNAVKSLTAALDILDAAIERRERAEAARRDLAEELAIMQEDRARLADELDASLERAERLAAAARSVGERLDRMDALCADLLADAAAAT